MALQDYEQLYADAGAQYGVDPKLLMAQGKVEDASGDPKAVGPDTPYGNAKGVAQLIPDTAKRLGVTDPTDPKQAIAAQAKLMAENIHRYKNIPDAVAAYHGGTDKSNWGPKTQNYQQKVLKNYQGTQMAENDNDPITQALLDHSAEKNLSGGGNSPADSNDPITQALLDHSESPPVANTDQAKIGTTEDILKSVPSAIARGVGATMQVPAYAGNLAAQTEGYLYRKGHNLFSNEPLSPQMEQTLKNIEPFYTGNTLPDALIQAGKQIVTGNPGQSNPLSGDTLHNPQTTPAKLVSAGIEGAIGGRLPVAGEATALKTAQGAGPIQNALSGVGAEYASEKYPNNPLATIIGGSLAPAAKGAVNYTLGSTSPEMASIAKQAQDRGINVPPGLMADSPMASKAYSYLSRVGLTSGDPVKDFTGSVAKNLLGINSDLLKNPEMAQAKQNIGQMYNQVAQMIDQSGGTKLSTSTINTINDMADHAVAADPAINKFKDMLIKAQDANGLLPAAQYKKLTQSGSILDNMQSSTKPEIKSAGQKIEKLLQNDLATSAGPNAKNMLQEADKQYAIWHMIDAARDDTTGRISPAKFSSEAWKRNADYFKSQKNLRNPSETYKMSQIADKLALSQSSGTAENALVPTLLGVGGDALAGSLVGGASGSVPAALATAAGGLLAGKAVGSALSSKWYRNYLINRANQPASGLHPLINYGLPPSAVVSGQH